LNKDKPRPDSILDLIEDLTGLQIGQQDQIIRSTGSKSPLKWNRVLVQESESYRLDIIKKMTPLDVEHMLCMVQRLHHLLDDYMQQLDEELDIRRIKKKLLEE
jgi:hypothetical protein